MLLTNDAPLRSMLGIDNIARAGIPTVLVPTTAGTGSEVTPNAIVTLPDEALKVGAVSRHLLPTLVLLDPLLTLSLPKAITAATGMEFRPGVHATDRRQPGGVLRTTGLGTGPCGHAAGLDVWRPRLDRRRYRRSTCPGLPAGGSVPCHPRGGQCHAAAPRDGKLVAQIVEWTHRLQIPQDLRAFGVEDQHIPELAIAASKVTRLMVNNPKAMSLEDIEAVYRCLLP